MPLKLLTSCSKKANIIYGEDASEDDAEAVEKALYEKYGNDVEISIVNGGQPIYYFIISVE